jgi:hypothetical protein
MGVPISYFGTSDKVVSASTKGAMAFATNARIGAEAAAAGTGTMIYLSMRMTIT